MAFEKYSKDGLVIPSRGTVLMAQVDTACPTYEQIETWWKGTRAAALQSSWKPRGYTSADALPTVESESEGGETKDVWEVAGIRKTPIKTNASIIVKYVQWTEEVLKHRFGNAGTINKQNKSFEIPDEYQSAEQAVLIIFADEEWLLVIYYPRMSSSPDGNLEPDGEKFMEAGVRYTRLASETGKKAALLGAAVGAE